MNPYFLLAGLIAFAMATGGAYLQGQSDGQDKCVAEQVRDEQVAQIASMAAAEAAASAISRIEVRHATVRQTLEREIIEKPVFRDCRSGADAVRLFNATLDPAPAASAPGAGELPATDPAAR
jgi:hypothetical protein